MTMTTPAGRVWDFRTDRKAYSVWIGLVWAAILLGFGLDLGRYLAEAPPPPLILHFHGATFAAWLVLVSIPVWSAPGAGRAECAFWSNLGAGVTRGCDW